VPVKKRWLLDRLSANVNTSVAVSDSDVACIEINLVQLRGRPKAAVVVPSETPTLLKCSGNRSSAVAETFEYGIAIS